MRSFDPTASSTPGSALAVGVGLGYSWPVVPTLPEPSPVSDAELVAQAVGGSMPARELLFKRHAQRAYRVAFAVLGDRADAQDAVQDGFVSACEKLDSLREGGAFGAWLCTSVVRHAQRTLRRRALWRRLGFESGASELDPGPLPGLAAEARAQVLQLLREMAKWPAAERTVFALQHFEEMTLVEIVEVTGMSRATVNRKLAAARARLGIDLARKVSVP